MFAAIHSCGISEAQVTSAKASGKVILPNDYFEQWIIKFENAIKTC